MRLLNFRLLRTGVSKCKWQSCSNEKQLISHILQALSFQMFKGSFYLHDRVQRRSVVKLVVRQVVASMYHSDELVKSLRKRKFSKNTSRAHWAMKEMEYTTSPIEHYPRYSNKAFFTQCIDVCFHFLKE